MLLNLIDNLPRSSAFDEALAQDDSLVDLDAKPHKYRPSVRDNTAEYELLAAIELRLKQLIQAQASKDLRLEPWPTPLTARERVERQQRLRDRDRVASRVEAAQQRWRELHDT